jgi:hypothetical protein
MTIFVVILLMVSGIVFSKRSTHMGAREYMIILLITLMQVAFFIFVFYTMEQPPGY